jgi:hypothetical protein
MPNKADGIFNLSEWSLMLCISIGGDKGIYVNDIEKPQHWGWYKLRFQPKYKHEGPIGWSSKKDKVMKLDGNW